MLIGDDWIPKLSRRVQVNLARLSDYHALLSLLLGHILRHLRGILRSGEKFKALALVARRSYRCLSFDHALHDLRPASVLLPREVRVLGFLLHRVTHVLLLDDSIDEGLHLLIALMPLDGSSMLHAALIE